MKARALLSILVPALAVLAPVARASWTPVVALAETDRSGGGFGHTGR